MGLLKKLFKKEQKQKRFWDPVNPEHLHAFRYSVEFVLMPSAAAYGCGCIFVHDDQDAYMLLENMYEDNPHFMDFYKVGKIIFNYNLGNSKGEIALLRFPHPQKSPEMIFGAVVLKYEDEDGNFEEPNEQLLPYYFLAKIGDSWISGVANNHPNVSITYHRQLDSPDVKQFLVWVLEKEDFTGCTVLDNDLLSIVK